MLRSADMVLYVIFLVRLSMQGCVYLTRLDKGVVQHASSFCQVVLKGLHDVQ